MYGDFSRWKFDPRTNFAGILHQQGRVLLDADTNDQTLLGLRWQDDAARDAFGDLVLAVPASERDAFRITSAAASASGLQVSLLPGRAWADGRLVHLVGDPPDPSAAVSRDAATLTLAGGPTAAEAQVLLLEVWRDGVSGFQVPAELIEPALGGPDTAERATTLFRLRVVDAAAGETCDEVARRAQDDLAARGRLTVSLAPTTATTGDCPVALHGGYSGLEHNLYLIEIAAIDPTIAGPIFKWSPQGGGLCGRGRIDATGRLVVTGAREAILRSGLTEAYVELLEPRPLRPGPSVSDRDAALAERWEVVYGARATLGSDGAFTFGQVLLGAPPAAGEGRAFRVWHGARPIDEFPTGLAEPALLRDGIRLEFDPSRTYEAGDRWSFTVRAGGLANPPILLDDAPPSGIVRARVPLARIRWEGGVARIDDCRRVFQPLTRQQTCCRLRVGDGVHSHGDFTSIQDAVDRLPAEGGEICVLPGIYMQSVSLEGKQHVIIRGCGEHTRISGERGAAIFSVTNSVAITLRDLNLRASAGQRGIWVEKSAGVRIVGNQIGANGAPAIDSDAATQLSILDNVINVRDIAGTDPAVVVDAIGAEVLRNRITVPSKINEAARQPRPSRALARPTLLASALGGLWIRGGSRSVEVVANEIAGGRGHGILLGHLEEMDPQGVIRRTRRPVEVQDDNPCPPGDLGIPTPGPDDEVIVIAGPPIEALRIADNTITGMGLCGVSVIGFLPTIRQGLISVCGLEIAANTIVGCLQRPLATARQEMLARMGYGGVVLADVEDLRITGNRIEDNGVRHVEAICGIYVLHVEGAEISRNRVVNNGPRTADAAAPQPGARGGIFVQLATSPVLDIDVTPGTQPASWIGADLQRRGLPALRACENTVVAPLGRALTVNALGPVLVTDNNLTTLGVAPGNGVVFAAVQILALGLSPELVGLRANFVGLRNGTLASRAAAPQPALALLGDAPNPSPNAENAAVAAHIEPVALTIAKPSPLLLLVPTGDVLFADNQILLDLRDAARELALSAIGVFSLDDIAFQGNQSSCMLLGDVVAVHAMVVALAVRVSDNRLKEPLPSALLSAITYGLMNTTANNQSTHCLLIRGTVRIDDNNIEAIDHLAPGACKAYDGILALKG